MHIALACVLFYGSDVLALRMVPVNGTSNERAVAFGDIDDVVNGGPDWADEEEHWEDFLEQTNKYTATTFDDFQNKIGNRVHLDNFVHVGKCAGSSIQGWLNLNRVAYHETHIKQVHTCGEEEHTWLFSVRDPIARAISSFNWRSPRNGDAQHGHNQFGDRERQFYSCFENFNDFAEALDDQTECGHYARIALNHPQGSEHLGMGVAWYLDSQLDCVLKQKVFLCRSESLVSDLEGFGKWIGVDNIDNGIPHTFSEYPMKNQTYISSKAEKRLREWLKKDYEVLRKLEEIAVNGKQ